MTIDEAIEYLKTQALELDAQGLYLRVQAVLLGIEALKAYKKAQEARWYHPSYKLPGETTD